jgi:hypothetical protein
LNSILDPVTNPAARVDSRADRFSRVVVPALAVRQDSTYASLEAVAESSTIVPYTSFAPGATFLSAGLVDRRDPFASVPVDLLFGNHGLGGGSALIAWTSPIVNEVVLGYSYTSSTDSDFQAGTLAHELLHIAVNRRLRAHARIITR